MKGEFPTHQSSGGSAFSAAAELPRQRPRESFAWPHGVYSVGQLSTVQEVSPWRQSTFPRGTSKSHRCPGPTAERQNRGRTLDGSCPVLPTWGQKVAEH